MLFLSSRAVITAGALVARRVARKGRKRGRIDNEFCSNLIDVHIPQPRSISAMAAAAPAHPADDDVAVSVPPAVRSKSLFVAGLEQLPRVKDKEGNILTDGFLDLCELQLPVIESFGPAFNMVRNDISNNIERVRKRKRTDPARFSLLFPLVEDEVARRDDGHSKSCTKAVLWLKRAMEFMLAIIRRLQELPQAPMSDVTYDMYHATLHRWHGFFCSSAFSVAMAFVPTREVFLDRLAGGRFSEAASDAMDSFVGSFGALLSEVHLFLEERGLDDPAKV